MPTPGRPSLYTKELADEICARLAKGETLRAICRSDERFPDAEIVRNWAVDNIENFYRQYARARDMGLDAMSEELFDIADDGSNDWIEQRARNGTVVKILDHEHVQRSRLRIDTRKWYLSKLAPKRYGERLLLESDGAQDEMMKELAAAIRDSPHQPEVKPTPVVSSEEKPNEA